MKSTSGLARHQVKSGLQGFFLPFCIKCALGQKLKCVEVKILNKGSFTTFAIQNKTHSC